MPARNNYFRAAAYMFANDDMRVVPLTERSIESFRRAATLMDSEVAFVEMPHEDGVSLPGYLCLRPPGARLPGRKTLVILYAGGADSTKEKLYFLFEHTGP